MTHGPITAAAIAAATEQGCRTGQNCPMRAGHPGDHDQTRLGAWSVPATWTLGDQMHFGGLLQHGRHVARELSSHFLTNLPELFTSIDRQFTLGAGQSELALGVYSDWLTAITAATKAARSAKMHTDAPHYMGRPCGATEGKVTSSAEDVNCPGCQKWMSGLGECAETRHATRGDCDYGFFKVLFQANLGEYGTREGETGHMCGSHAKQAAAKHEVTILETIVNP